MNKLTSTLENSFEYLEERGFKPKFHMIENEAATNTIKMIKRQQIKLQIVPRDLRRKSPADRAIRAAKIAHCH